MISDERIAAFDAWVNEEIGFEGLPRKQIVKAFKELLEDRKEKDARIEELMNIAYVARKSLICCDHFCGTTAILKHRLKALDESK